MLRPPSGALGIKGASFRARRRRVIHSAALGFGATNMSAAELYGAYVVASLSRQAQKCACRFHSALPSYSCRPAPDPGWVHELKHDGYRFTGARP